jgi:hypothetical protein
VHLQSHKSYSTLHGFQTYLIVLGIKKKAYTVWRKDNYSSALREEHQKGYMHT